MKEIPQTETPDVGGGYKPGPEVDCFPPLPVFPPGDVDYPRNPATPVFPEPQYLEPTL